jgi:hypothetical protein
VDVYILDGDLDRVRGFDTVHPDGLDRLQPFDTSPMAPTWRPVEVFVHDEDLALPASDFSRLGGGYVFSERAAEALGDLLLGRGELLELDYGEAVYFVYNVTRLTDALDEERTKFAHFPSSGRIMAIERYEFISDRLAEETVFKLPQMPETYAYVTDAFIRRVEEAGLTGFRFERRVWSGPAPAAS